MRRSLLAGLTAAAVAAFAASAEAGPRGRHDDGYVVAHSRYGGQSIAAPVRTGPKGRLEVRLPGGTWIECGRSCRDTLRRETIDFWKSRETFDTDGPGYIQFRF
ncbi:MAG: hypothetical protein F9K29_22335 [Hyphomicrobiaceae bacterium]|nr:MAG: hypothetical protein F9K29_22335 [Hyphomicrobiaceae bacterium]